ncbi:MAG TPA: sulfotransferase [Gaiellaceae bacterium]|nr:sulfotransferase [Gaiellaceae bacterium]
MAEPPVRVLYVAGVSHCGSTLVGAVLGQVEGVFFAGELAHVARALERDLDCGCGRPLRECPVWTDVFAALGEGTPPDLLRLEHAEERARALLRHLARERGWLRPSPPVEKARAAYIEALRAICATTGSRLVVDSSKSPAYGRLLDVSDGVDLRVLHLVRDPRGTAWSWRKAPELTSSPVQVAAVWSVWNPTIELLWRRRRGRYLRLRYEDFARAPRESLRRVLDFAGEPGAELPFVSEREVELAPTHGVAGNRRFAGAGRVEIVCDDDWQKASGFSGRRTVSALTWPLRRRYGY